MISLNCAELSGCREQLCGIFRMKPQAKVIPVFVFAVVDKFYYRNRITPLVPVSDFRRLEKQEWTGLWRGEDQRPGRE